MIFCAVIASVILNLLQHLNISPEAEFHCMRIVYDSN